MRPAPQVIVALSPCLEISFDFALCAHRPIGDPASPVALRPWSSPSVLRFPLLLPYAPLAPGDQAPPQWPCTSGLDPVS